MKLSEAIKILYDIAYLGIPTNNQKSQDALKLLIEAGKRIQANREHSIPGPMFLLPGETLE